MKKYFLAQIDWIPYEEGGRKKIPPEGIRYCPLINICGIIGLEVWSIDFICPNFEEKNIIKFKFLVDDAPYELLVKNITYDIYEGSKKVAKLKIVDCCNSE